MLHFYLKMHHNAFGCWALPVPTGTGGAYSASHDPLAGLRGRGGRGGEGGKKGEGPPPMSEVR